MKKYNYQLKLPSYEELKALPLKYKNKYDEDDYYTYYIHLFDTPVDVYGRFTLNEDGEGFIIFDVMEDGYCEQNDLGKCLKFNKKNYKEICKHANKVYNDFIETLLNQEYIIWD